MKSNDTLDQFEKEYDTNEANNDYIFSPTGELIAKGNLLNERSIFYKGLLGLIFCILGGIIGLVLVRISLNQAKEAIETYRNQTHLYKKSSFLKVKRGQRLARIGLAIFFGEIVILVAFMSAH